MTYMWILYLMTNTIFGLIINTIFIMLKLNDIYICHQECGCTCSSYAHLIWSQKTIATTLSRLLRTYSNSKRRNVIQFGAQLIWCTCCGQLRGVWCIWSGAKYKAFGVTAFFRLWHRSLKILGHMRLFRLFLASFNVL